MEYIFPKKQIGPTNRLANDLLEIVCNAAGGANLISLRADLLARIGVTHVVREGLRYTSAPWNLLVTRRWMLVVPRLCERFEGVAINALGFAGSLFVRDDVQRRSNAPDRWRRCERCRAASDALIPFEMALHRGRV